MATWGMRCTAYNWMVFFFLHFLREPLHLLHKSSKAPKQLVRLVGNSTFQAWKHFLNLKPFTPLLTWEIFMMNTVDMNNNNNKKIRSLITNHVVRWLTDDSRVRFRLIIFRSYELRAGRFVQGGNLPRRRNKHCTQSERRKAPLHSTRLCVHSKTASSWTGGTRELVEPVSYDSFVPTSFRAFESMRPFDRDGSRREPAGGILLYSQTVTFAI